ncbi:MAG: response regulator [Pseudomonadota bacterium]
MEILKALIADDEGGTRHLLRSLLRQNNINVVGEAANGVDTLRLCKKLQPNVLILDINMPKMNGFEVLKSIRSAFPDIVVIMISSDASLSNVQEACTYGVDNFLVKPFKAGQLIDAIYRNLK